MNFPSEELQNAIHKKLAAAWGGKNLLQRERNERVALIK